MPGKTPAPIVERIQQETAKALALPDVRRGLPRWPMRGSATRRPIRRLLQGRDRQVHQGDRGCENPEAIIANEDDNATSPIDPWPIWPCAGAVPAQAQNYPNKTVRIVVPYGPGGGVSLLAQQVGQKMQELMKQPVVIDNRPGAGGNLGADLVASRRPTATRC